MHLILSTQHIHPPQVLEALANKEEVPLQLPEMGTKRLPPRRAEGGPGFADRGCFFADTHRTGLFGLPETTKERRFAWSSMVACGNSCGAVQHSSDPAAVAIC